MVTSKRRVTTPGDHDGVVTDLVALVRRARR